MYIRSIFFIFALLAGLDSAADAQAHLFYVDTAGSFIDLANQDTITNSQGNEGVVVAFAERFDLPPGPNLLDSVDFDLASIDTDSVFVDIAPARSVDSGGVQAILPDERNPMRTTRIYSEKPFIAGPRMSVNCRKLSVGDTFFIMLASADGRFACRAQEQESAFDTDTARAILETEPLQPPFGPVPALIDGNLVPSGVNVNLDIGITYENFDGVKVHLSSTGFAPIAFPNPASRGNPIHFTGTATIVSVRVFDDAGRSMRTVQGNAGAPIIEIPTQGLSSGAYSAILYNSKGEESSIQFIIR